MRLSTLMTDNSRAAYAAEKQSAFLIKASGFLNRNYPNLVADLPPETQDAFILDAMEDARACGFHTEREFLNFLIPTALLGEGFISNPLLHPLRRAAFWINAAGADLVRPGFPRLFDAVDLWHQRRMGDMADPARLRTALTSPLPDQISFSDAQRLFYLCWPTVLHRVPPENLRMFADHGMRAAQAAGLAMDTATRLLCVQIGAGHRAGLARLHPELSRPVFDADAALAALTRMDPA